VEDRREKTPPGSGRRIRARHPEAVGLFGLRQSFELAGGRTLVMSLWKVLEDITCHLMERFYHHLLNGEDRLTALREA
jgi:CHAT domain-containing protein